MNALPKPTSNSYLYRTPMHSTPGSVHESCLAGASAVPDRRLQIPPTLGQFSIQLFPAKLHTFAGLAKHRKEEIDALSHA